jgi:hypothetical protein
VPGVRAGIWWGWGWGWGWGCCQPLAARNFNEGPCHLVPGQGRRVPFSAIALARVQVKVVMAIGDSITAAFAAEGSIIEYRDESWSIGGGANKTTM